MAVTTTPGYVNGRGRVVLGPTGRPGTDHGQSIYVLSCGRCAQVYGANGSDPCAALPELRRRRARVQRLSRHSGGRPVHPRARNPNWTRDELILALVSPAIAPISGP